MAKFEIVPGLIYADRAGWVADESLPRLGHLVARAARDKVIVYHTAAVDRDDTPNLWESEAEVFSRMRGLQRARPDLGLDVPYNFTAFCLKTDPPSLYVCEGRGEDLSGAHTPGHNSSGIAIALYGDFTTFEAEIAPYLQKLSYFLGWLKYDPNSPGYGGPYAPIERLGSVQPGDDRAVFGHRDLTPATSCPGDHLYRHLGLLAFADPRSYRAEDGKTLTESARLKRLERLMAGHGIRVVIANLTAEERALVVRRADGDWLFGEAALAYCDRMQFSAMEGQRLLFDRTTDR